MEMPGVPECYIMQLLNGEMQFKTHHTLEKAQEVIELDAIGYLPYAISKKVGLDVRTVKKILETNQR